MKEKEIENLIEDIIEICNYYGKLKNDFLGVNELINKRQKLSVLFFFLNSKQGELKENELIFKSVYEKKLTALKLQYNPNGAQGTKVANFKCEKEKEQFDLSSSVTERIKHLITGTKSVLDSMNQHISVISKEKHYNNFVR